MKLGGDVNLEELARETEHYSGADLERMCEKSIKSALKQVHLTLTQRIKESGLKRQDLRDNFPTLTKQHLTACLKDLAP